MMVNFEFFYRAYFEFFCRAFRKVCLLIISFGLMNSTLDAHPVIWKDGHATMYVADSSATSLTYHYSFNYDWSLGVRQLTFKSSQDSYAMVVGNWLVKRWYGDDYQGNIYVMSGLGSANLFGAGTSSASTRASLFHLAAQADWETRDIYTLFKADYYQLDTATLSLRGRLGFAPYLGDFDDIHTWIMLQVDDAITTSGHQVTAMPVVRIFKDNYLFEFGHNFSDESFFAAMLHI